MKTQFTIKHTVHREHYIKAIGYLLSMGYKITKKSIEEKIIFGLESYGYEVFLQDDGFDWEEAENLFIKIYEKSI